LQTNYVLIYPSDIFK